MAPARDCSPASGSLTAPCSGRRRRRNRTDQEDIVSKTFAVLSAVLMCALPGPAASLRAQQAHPDFTGVYYPINPFGNVRPATATPPPPATATPGAVPPPRPVLVLDGRE